MIILNLEIIDLYGRFKQFVLDFFNNNIFAVDKDKDISRTEFGGIRPSLDRTVERIRRCGNDLLSKTGDGSVSFDFDFSKTENRPLS